MRTQSDENVERVRRRKRKRKKGPKSTTEMNSINTTVFPICTDWAGAPAAREENGPTWHAVHKTPCPGRWTGQGVGRGIHGY